MLLHSSRCGEEDVPAPVHLAAQRWGGGFKVGGLPDVRAYPGTDCHSYELWLEAFVKYFCLEIFSSL